MRSALVALLAFAAAASQAQEFIPGYVVAAEGDTLRGSVVETIDITAGREVTFRSGPDAEPRTFTPQTALGYGDGSGRRYVARTVRPEFEGAAADYFVQVIVDGQLDLLKLAYAPDDDRFFVQAEGAEPDGLYLTRDRVYRTEARRPSISGRPYDEVRHRYRTTLARAFFGCPALQRETEDVDLNERDLVRAVAEFNECVGASPTVAAPEATRKRSDLAFRFTPRLGVGAVSFSTDGRNGWRATPQVAPYGGLQIEAVLLNVGGRASLTLEGSVQQKARTPDGFVFPTEPRVAADRLLGTTYGVLSYGGRYAHSSMATSPYLGVGFVTGFVLDAPDSFTYGFVDRVYPPTKEGGAYAEAGGELPAPGGPVTIGLRVERTVLDTVSPLALILGGPSWNLNSASSAYNTTLTFVVGKRFGG